MRASPPHRRRRLRSSLPLQAPASQPRLRWADQIGSSAQRMAEASTAPGKPAPLPPCAASSSAWLTPASSSRLAATSPNSTSRRPWWIYTATSAVASAVLSFLAFSWGPTEASAESIEVEPTVRVVAFDPQVLADAEFPSLETGNTEALLDAGRKLAKRGEHAKALPYLEAAAVRRPDDAPLQLQLGDTRLALGAVEMARQHYRAARDAGSEEATRRLRLLGS